MLGKLLKHEFKATGRNFLLMYLFFVVITVCNKIFLEITVQNDFWEVFQSLFLIAYILTCAAIFVLTTVLIIMRFYKNMTGDEGYLTHTLPVSVGQHIIAKALPSFVWSVLSMLLFLASVLFLCAGHIAREDLNYLHEFWNRICALLGSQLWSLIIIYTLSMIAAAFYNILQYYMSIAIGQLVNKHRVLTSFVAYFGINFVLQNVISFLLIGTNFLGLDSNIPVKINSVTEFTYVFVRYMNILGIISLFISLALSVIFFFVTRYILSKKLNLE